MANIETDEKASGKLKFIREIILEGGEADIVLIKIMGLLYPGETRRALETV